MIINMLPPPASIIGIRDGRESYADMASAGHKHLHWLDVSKGIGIILVILAHSIFPFGQEIDYFHMPLFFIIAGITFKQKTLNTFLIGKINRIMIPWIFWSITSAILSLIPHGYGGVFNGPLWFLQNIFVALIIVYLFSTLKRKYLIIAFTGILFLSYAILNIPKLRQVLPFGIPLALISSQFIIIGNTLQRRNIFSKNSRIYYILLTVIITGLYGVICHYLSVNGVTGSYVSLELFSSNFIGSYLSSITGSLIVIFLSIAIKQNKILEWLGRNSLAIMCVHFPFCMFLDGYLVQLPYFSSALNKLILASSEWLFVIAISCCICIICKRFIPRLTGYKPFIK